MDRQQLVDRVATLIGRADQVLATHKDPPPNVFGFPTLDSGAFASWRNQSLGLILQAVGPEHPYAVSFSKEVQRGFRSSVQSGKGILEALREDIAAGHLEAREADSKSGVLPILENIASRFHQVARQLRYRYDRRPTFDVRDEYDVQDLLHALLRLHFDDIRPEEHTPSYAGKSTRMDFLLKSERVVVEVKKTRQSMSAGDLGTQLIEDIARYASHPDCDALVCFVYDPEGILPNPRGLERDLNSDEVALPVRVFIRP